MPGKTFPFGQRQNLQREEFVLMLASQSQLQVACTYFVSIILWVHEQVWKLHVTALCVLYRHSIAVVAQRSAHI